MKRLLLSLLLQLCIFSSSFADNTLKVIDPWIPETPPGAKVMAGFMQLQNTGSEPIIITAAASPAFQTVEMHLSKEVDGVAKMLPQDNLQIAPGKTLVLKPGSYHLMFINPHRRLTDGESANITLTLQNGTQLEFSAPIKKSTAKRLPIMRCGSGKCGGGKCGSGK